jgi:type III secretory pathway component EscT
MALTIGLLPAVSHAPSAASQPLGGFALGVAGEVVIGLAMGMSLALVFTAAQWAGETDHAADGAEPFRRCTTRDPAGQVGSLSANVLAAGRRRHFSALTDITRCFAASRRVLTRCRRCRSRAGTSIVALMVGLLQVGTGLAIQLAAPVFVTMLAST